MPGWMELAELSGVGSADRGIIMSSMRPNKVTLSIDGELHVLRPRTAFRGTVPGTGAHFMLVTQSSGKPGFGYGLDSVGLIYAEQDDTAVIGLVRALLREANPFKNRVVLVNRDLRTVRSRISERSWKDIIPHERARKNSIHCGFYPRSRNAQGRGIEPQTRALAFRSARRRKIVGYRMFRQRYSRGSHGDYCRSR
jgi:hypothetical protein